MTRTKSATKEYDFEDMHMDLFMVYDYRQTQVYWGKNSGISSTSNKLSTIGRKRK